MLKIFIATSSFSELSSLLINKFKKKKIKFTKSKITPEIAVAKLIIGYILSIYRNIHDHDNNLKKLDGII